MQKSIFILLLALNGLVLGAQNTYSYRFDFGFPAAELTSIIATDSCYYSTGIIADSIPPIQYRKYFCQIFIGWAGIDR